MEQMRKLPIGIQTFEKLREENYLYVDKTAWLSNLRLFHIYGHLSPDVIQDILPTGFPVFRWQVRETNLYVLESKLRR